MTTSTFQREYQALCQGAALQLRPNAGTLMLSDADRSDFLHRMTTNNINALKVGQSAVTVLTNATARIVFAFSVVCRDEVLWLLPATGETNALLRHLRSQIFFMDKVKVRDASLESTRLRLMGPQATQVVTQLITELGGTLAESATPMRDDACQSVEGVLIVRQDKYDLPGYELVVANNATTRLLAHLQALNVIQLEDDAAYQTRRIELGRPQAGQELTSESNPLEAGLAWTCAENKGCYTGQEIIARQLTYDKVTKTLVGLRCSAPVQPRQRLQVDGREVGSITSATSHPEVVPPLALAIVKRPHNTTGSILLAEGVVCTVTNLPFVTA